jgi:hypothetical protein
MDGGTLERNHWNYWNGTPSSSLDLSVSKLEPPSPWLEKSNQSINQISQSINQSSNHPPFLSWILLSLPLMVKKGKNQGPKYAVAFTVKHTRHRTPTSQLLPTKPT